MKNKDKRVKCTVCGTFLFNDLSISVALCREHRPVLSPVNEVRYRQFIKNYPKEVKAQIEAMKNGTTKQEV